MSPRLFLSLTLSICCATGWAAPVEVRINQVRDMSTYMLDLMKLALSYTTDTSYVFVETPERLSKNAEREAALAGTISVYWGGTSEDQERDFIPVRIDGYRGLMGMRFLIIRQGDQARFSTVYNLEDLQRIRMGQGKSWNDVRILRASGIPVVHATLKESLFHMLEGGRFDAFPRGATEAWMEAEAHRDLGLTVEKELVIQYSLPAYFFVHKDHPELARNIEHGLECALEDGSLDRYFYGTDRVKQFLANADLEARRVIHLDNPFLPASANRDKAAKFNLTIEQLVDGTRRFKENASSF